jgi:hypothetical protein
MVQVKSAPFPLPIAMTPTTPETNQPQLIPTLVALIGAVAVSAAPLTETRAASETCVYTCGSVCYWQSDIDAAVSKGVSLQQSGQEIGELCPAAAATPIPSNHSACLYGIVEP